MTNYEMKKAIFNEMVARGYYMDKTQIEEICKDDFYKVKTIEKWKQKFFEYLIFRKSQYLINEKF